MAKPSRSAGPIPPMVSGEHKILLTEAIRAYLPEIEGRPPLMMHATLEWKKRFGEAATGSIIIWTDRQLTSDGGDGWSGMDAADIDYIENALENYVADIGAFAITGFEIRQRKGIPIATDQIA